MKILDLVIIGSGPAGMSAAIYAKRAMLDTLVIEKEAMAGGQIVQTYEIDNYPGIPGVNGMDLSDQFAEHAKKLGVETKTAEVVSIEVEGKYKKILLKNGEELQTKAIILAMGASHQKLEIPGEDEFAGMGVSYCATCDGAFFRNKTVAVVGGGDVALEDAIFLSRVCEKVYLIHRRDEFRGTKVLQEQVKNTPNIEVLYDTIVTEINGKMKVDSITIKNVNNHVDKPLSVDGIFIAIGIKPEKIMLKEALELNEQGYIVASEDGITNIPGIFVGGDQRAKKLRQVVTAVADGANCVASVEKYLQKFELSEN